MSSPRKRSPCQRYNKDTDECENCTPANNSIPFSKCVKYTEYKGNDLFLELVWRVYQLVECMDLECREFRGEGHRLRLVYIYRELYKVHGVNTLVLIKKSFLDTFGNVLGEYYYKWLVIELEGQEKLPEDFKIEEDYDEEYPVNMFEVLDVEEEHEDYFTPTINYNELMKTRNRRRKRRPSQESSIIPTRFLTLEDDDIFKRKNKFIVYVIERLLAFNVYAGNDPTSVYNAIENYPDNIFFPIIYCTTQIRIMSDNSLTDRDRFTKSMVLSEKYKDRAYGIIEEMQQSHIDSANVKKPMYRGFPSSSLTLLIFRYTQFVFIEYSKHLTEMLQHLEYSEVRAARTQKLMIQRRELFLEIMLHKDANAKINKLMVDMFSILNENSEHVYTENDVDDVLMRFVQIYLRKSDINDPFVRGFVFRIIRSQQPIIDYKWILQNAPTLK